MQYMTLIGSVNIPFPGSLHWMFSAIAFAFASITSGSLSLDCLLDVNGMNLALQRTLWHLGIPVFSLLILTLIQIIWLVMTFIALHSCASAFCSCVKLHKQSAVVYSFCCMLFVSIVMIMM